MATSVVTGLEERLAVMEREAGALRKLIEAAHELGEERVREYLAETPNGNSDVNGVVADVARPPFTSEPTENGPRGREAVRLIVRERPGIWTLVDLRAEMKRRGWFTSPKGVDVAVTRLVASREARRVGKGRYEFFAPDGEEGAIESDTSGAAVIALR